MTRVTSFFFVVFGDVIMPYPKEKEKETTFWRILFYLFSMSILVAAGIYVYRFIQRRSEEKDISEGSGSRVGAHVRFHGEQTREIEIQP